ncbi:SMI1/KNR4 family protein [Bacillus subtilis]|uniref:SMI1/KNR4 family protein n=1 Tax=Bacillus subtilis TaxID=1423 RepID=UPI003CEC1296
MSNKSFDIYLRVKRLLEDNKENSITTGGISDKKVYEIEDALNVRLPNSYKWFLKNYGSGGAYGVLITGYDFGGAEVVDWTNMYRREFNLPSGFVVVEDVDYFAYCIDTNKMKNGECPVVSWDRVIGFTSEDASSFIEFFYEKLLRMKEDWEEDE